jgi:hypothetical protein
MRVNFKNLAENLIIIIVTNILTAFIVYKVTVKTNIKAIEAFSPTIEKAIDKETIKNEIKNEIQIDKIKKSDSLVIKMDPTNNQKPVNIIAGETDCIPLMELSKRELRVLKKRGLIE